MILWNNKKATRSIVNLICYREKSRNTLFSIAGVDIMETFLNILMSIGCILFFGGIAIASFIMSNPDRFKCRAEEDNNEEYY